MQALTRPHRDIAPQQLMQALLRHAVDLLWFGGIGTYVKAARRATARPATGPMTIRVDADELQGQGRRRGRKPRR